MALKLEEMARLLRSNDFNNAENSKNLKEVANDARQLAYILNPKASSEKDILVEVLCQLSEDLDEVTDLKGKPMKWIIVQLKELTDKLECWNTDKEYINPLN